MGRLTTHVLDTANGRPAAAVRIRVYRVGATGERQLLREATTNMSAVRWSRCSEVCRAA